RPGRWGPADDPRCLVPVRRRDQPVPRPVLPGARTARHPGDPRRETGGPVRDGPAGRVRCAPPALDPRGPVAAAGWATEPLPWAGWGGPVPPAPPPAPQAAGLGRSRPRTAPPAATP